MMKQIVLLILLAVAVTACQKESKTETPEPVPERVQVAIPSIASVQMLEDCPDPSPATPAADPPAKSAPAESRPASMTAPSDSAEGYRGPCSQATIQLAFTGQGEHSSKVLLRELRLLTASGDPLGTIKARLPSVWQDNAYLPWDQVVMPKVDLKVSYKLSPPDWTEVESKLGGSSSGAMFILEVDVEIGGVVKTLRSGQFARQQPEMVPT